MIRRTSCASLNRAKITDMLHSSRWIPLLLLSSLLVVAPTSVDAQTADPDPTRFAEAIAQFEEWDSQNAVPENGVLFVGSSSIVRWPTAERFPGLPVINRGFGGSHISDVNHYIDETVLRHAPGVIVFYAGNNDISAGKTAEQVLSDYRTFVERVLTDRPDTKILFIAIHPSILRWADWPEMRRANDLVREFCEGDPALHYLDVASPMLGPDGEPRPELLVEDNLHLSAAGYDVWTPIVAQAIDAVTLAGSRP